MADGGTNPLEGDFRVGDWLCEPRRHRLTGEGRAAQVEPKVMQVLVCLAERGGQVVTRGELLDRVWGDAVVGEQVLSRAISELRKVFGDDSRTPRVIETIAKSGYRLLPRVEPAHASARGDVAGRDVTHRGSTPAGNAPTGIASGAGAAVAPQPASGAEPTPGASRQRTIPGPGTWRGVWLFAAGALVGALFIVALRNAAPGSDRGGSHHAAIPWSLSLLLPAEAPPELSWFRSFELSPDARRLVYTANIDGARQLYMRRLDRPEAVPIPGTEGGYGPFFSADGTQIGFYVAGSLRRVPVGGGEPVTLYNDASDPMGATWATDGTLVYSRRLLEGLHWMPPAEKPRPLTELRADERERSHFWPHFLPDGRHLLFAVWRGGGIRHGNIELLDAQTGERRVLIRGGTSPRLVGERLFFARSGRLMQVRFDSQRLEVTGAESLIVEDLLTHPVTGAAHFSVANDGTIVYAPRDAFAIGRTLMRLHPDGRAEGLSKEHRPYGTPQLSPDGRQLAVTLGGSNMQVWVVDVQRGTAERLTRDGHNFLPVWTPDGRRIAFSSERAGPYNVYWKLARVEAPVERLTNSDNMQFPGSWSPDGRSLVYSEFHPKTRWDIWILPVDGDRVPQPFLVTEFDEFRPEFSPGGDLVAYVSNESGKWDKSGRWEVYLRTRHDPETRVRVSTHGGSDPCWSRDGSQLYYRVGDRIEVVRADGWPHKPLGSARVVHTGLRLPELVENITTYDVDDEGRILTVRLGEPAQPTALTALLRAPPSTP